MMDVGMTSLARKEPTTHWMGGDALSGRGLSSSIFGDGGRSLSIDGRDTEAESMIERMVSATAVNVHDQESINYTLSKSICEDFHALARAQQEGGDDVYEKSLLMISDGVQVLEQTMRTTGRRETKLAAALKQLRSEREAYRVVLMAEEFEEESEQFKNESTLAHACAMDDDVRELVILLRWSEQMAADDPSGFADLCKEYTSMDNVTNLKRETLSALSRQQSAAAASDLGLDYDGKSVDDDAQLIDKCYRIAFALIRCGHYEEARHLLIATGASCLAPLLSMRSVLESMEKTPVNVDSPYAQILQKRKLFKKTVNAILNKEGSTISAPLRMLWASLAGRVEPLLSLANKTEDRIWVLANAAVEARLDALAGGDVMCDAPGSVQSIFEEVLPHESWPYFPIYSALLRRNSADAVLYAEKWLSDYEQPDKSAPEHLLRFMAHLVVVFRNTRREHDIIRGNRIILKYTGRLFQLSLTHLIPFYARYLNDATSHLVILQTAYRLKSTAARKDFLDAVAATGMDYRPLCRQLVVKSREDEKNDASDLIDKFRWLLYKERETEEDAVVEACVLLRRFLEKGQDDSVRALLSVCASREGSLADRVKAHGGGQPGRAGDAVRRAVEEYTTFVLYVTGLDAYDAWRTAHADRANETRRKESIRSEAGVGSSMLHSAEEALENRRYVERADRLRTSECVLRQKGVDVLDAFLRHGGWRRIDAEAANATQEEKAHSESLRVLRDRYYGSALIRIAQMQAESGEERAALETATLVHALRLDKDISKEQLRSFLSYIHKVAGHTLL